MRLYISMVWPQLQFCVAMDTLPKNGYYRGGQRGEKDNQANEEVRALSL